MSILKEESGKFSSKRAVGLLYAVLGAIIVLYGLFTDNDTDIQVLIVVIGTSLGALGITSIANMGNNKINNKK